MKLPVFLLAFTGLLSAQSTYVLKAARMFDGASGQLTTPGAVVVSDGKIQSVGSGNAPAGATVIDLRPAEEYANGHVSGARQMSGEQILKAILPAGAVAEAHQ